MAKNTDIAQKISSLLELFTDIIFPKNLELKKLETMSSREIFETLPPSGPVENGGVKIDISLHALFQYKDPVVKQIIWEIKYRGNKKLVHEIGKLMYEKIHNTFARENLIIIPIPASPGHLKERGFNQTELIAKALMENFLIDEKTNKSNAKISISYRPDILMKIKNTPSQASLSARSMRLKNLTGAFAIKKPLEVFGKNIIVIDDVITTGATMKEATRVLILAGAESVIGFAIAH